MTGAAPGAPGGYRIPPPPPRHGKPYKRPSDPRWWIWTGALALGIALGVVAYRWLPRVDTYFDYWLALVLS
jgi:hypothetical protein